MCQSTALQKFFTVCFCAIFVAVQIEQVPIHRELNFVLTWFLTMVNNVLLYSMQFANVLFRERFCWVNLPYSSYILRYTLTLESAEHKLHLFYPRTSGYTACFLQFLVCCADTCLISWFHIIWKFVSKGTIMYQIRYCSSENVFGKLWKKSICQKCNNFVHRRWFLAALNFV